MKTEIIRKATPFLIIRLRRVAGDVWISTSEEPGIEILDQAVLRPVRRAAPVPLPSASFEGKPLILRVALFFLFADFRGSRICYILSDHV
jgi:hypothetical protein